MTARWRQVRTPAELAKVLEDGDYAEITGGGHYEVGGSATVTASGPATVTAYDSATVTAYGSATVTAYDSATVRASGSATVRAYGSATVTAYDSATVRASGSATVRAYDSATVTASGSATVRAYDSATVTASKRVAIHKHSRTINIGGGVIIDHTDVEITTTEQWLDEYNIPVVDGIAVLFKQVGPDWLSQSTCTLLGEHRGWRASYAPGSAPEAPDWDPTPECGRGLHLSPTPSHTFRYADQTKPRFLACPVRVEDIVVIPGGGSVPDKVKVPRIVAPGCSEVNEFERPVTREVAA